MLASHLCLARLGGPGCPAAEWVDAREARAAEGGLRAPLRRGDPRTPDPRMSRNEESEHQWIV